MSEPRRFKLVEDPEGLVTEDHIVHGLGIPEAIPEPKPTYPEWSDEWCERVSGGLATHGAEHLADLYDRGLLVVERDEWERLTKIEGSGASTREDEDPTQQTGEREPVPAAEGMDRPDPSYSDEEIERAAGVLWRMQRTTAWHTATEWDRHLYRDYVTVVLSAARPDPAKWVPKEHYVKRGLWRAAMDLYAEALRQHDEARARIAELEAVPAPDLRPTEEQVRAALRERGWWTDPIDAHILRARKDGWLRGTKPPLTERQAEEGFCCRTECCGPGSWCCQHANEGHACDGDTEAPPAPLPAEVQEVLDAAVAWQKHGGLVSRHSALVRAVRAYEATLPKEGEG